MSNQEHFFLYHRRFNLSFIHIIESFNNSLKYKLLNFLYKNNFTSKHIHLFDYYSLKRTIFNDVYSYNKTNNDIKKTKSFKEINLKEIDYFEALEIDDFDNYRNRITSKFSNDRLLITSRSKEELKEKLAEIKKKFDSISWGNLFYLNFKKKRKPNNDLIEVVDVNYIKTNESYFILKIKVSPSEKFKKIFAKIIDSEEVILSKHHYHSYYKILKSKRFFSHHPIIIDSKCFSIENLLSDLNQQVKKNITKNFKGYFHNSKIDSSLPSIEFYEVNDFDKFHNDSSLMQNFKTGFDGHYSLEDNQIEIYFSNSKKRSTRLQVVKQKGHGNIPQVGKDHTNYDSLETSFLLNSLAFPCVFRGILIEIFEKLNSLKRDIYDFGHNSKKTNIIKSILFFKYNNSYLELKQTLVQILIITKRFENEFTKNKLALYTNEFNLEGFTPRNYRGKSEKKNFLYDIVKESSNSLKTLKDKTNSINEIFKSIEELNSYRTNYLLQIISLFIACLAFIFAFDKAKEFCVIIFHLIIK